MDADSAQAQAYRNLRMVGECVDLCATDPKEVLSERGREGGTHVFIRKGGDGRAPSER